MVGWVEYEVLFFSDKPKYVRYIFVHMVVSIVMGVLQQWMVYFRENPRIVRIMVRIILRYMMVY